MTTRRITEWGGGIPFAVGMVALMSLALLPFRPLVDPSAFMLASVLVIIAVARLSGLRASGVAAVLAFVALDFLFVAPYYRFTVAKNTELLALLVFLVVALLAGQQTALLRRREQAALRRQERLVLLYRLAERISSESSADAIARFVVDEVMRVLRAQRAALYVRDEADKRFGCLAYEGIAEPAVGEIEGLATVQQNARSLELPSSAQSTASPSRATQGVSRAPEATGLLVPLPSAERIEGVLAVVAPLADEPADAEQFLQAVATLAAAALERLRLAHDAARAEATAQAEGLKSTLVASVSHELKTPLAAATMRVTGLLEEGRSTTSDRMVAELGEVAEELARLDSSIGDLLAVSRLESDSWRPRLEAEESYEIISLAYSRVPTYQRARVDLRVADDLPLVCVDLGQIVRALGNLVGNALAYSPPGSPVLVSACRTARTLEIAVSDQGPGIPHDERQKVFGKFYRGSSSSLSPGGTGLGLAIANEIVRNHGGEIRIEDAAGGGARFVMSLPAVRSDDAQEA